MTLPELSIKRHVFAFMANAVLVLFGLIAYSRMGMDKLPYIEFPTISVTTVLRGANPDVVDAAITNIIETSINGVPGIEHINSTSSPGTSRIDITFNLEKRIDVALAVSLRTAIVLLIAESRSSIPLSSPPSSRRTCGRVTQPRTAPACR